VRGKAALSGLDGPGPAVGLPADDLLALDEALTNRAERDARAAQPVRAHCFERDPEVGRIAKSSKRIKRNAAGEAVSAKQVPAGPAPPRHPASREGGPATVEGLTAMVV